MGFGSKWHYFVIIAVVAISASLIFVLFISPPKVYATSDPGSEITLVLQKLDEVKAFGDQDISSFGSPITPVVAGSAGSGIEYFQLFQAANNPYKNSVEKIKDTQCYYVAYTSPTSPYWYDTWNAVESDSQQDSSLHREWAGDSRTLRDIMGGVPITPITFPPTYDTSATNWDSTHWESLAAPFHHTYGPPFPPGRGPAPHWFKVCLDQNGQPIIDSNLQPTDNVVSDPGACNGFDAPEWEPLEETLVDGITLHSHITWIPESATGIVGEAWRSGDDFGSNHYPPNTPYYQGNFPYAEGIDPNKCNGGLGVIADAFCNDWENGLYPDPPSKKFVGNFISSGGDKAYYVPNVWTETEQWQFPPGYRPDPGDRATLVGRLIQDCGHDDNHFELHPLEAAESSFLQNGVLTRYEPSVNPGGGVIQMGNLPNISDQWNSLTQNAYRDATITKIALSQDWQGEDLTFEVWPPARPSIDSGLHWTDEGWFADSGMAVDATPSPPENPNHLLVHVYHTPTLEALRVGSFPSMDDVIPGTNRGLAFSFILWWDDKTPPTVTGTPDRAPDHNGWYNHPVIVTWKGDDNGGSGLASCDSPTNYFAPDGGSITITGHCTDNAGNVGSVDVNINYDSTPPNITSSQDGQNIILNQPGVLPDFHCSDSTSGVATCTGPTTALDTSHVGPYSFTVTSTDNAGNTVTKTIKYTVAYKFNGFSSPIPNSQYNLGRIIPVKLQLFDYNNKIINTATVKVYVKYGSLTAPISAKPGSGSTGNTMKLETNQYTYSLSTSGYTPTMPKGILTIVIIPDDGVQHSENVKLK